MSVITKEVAKKMLEAWLDADMVLATNQAQSYTIGGQTLTRLDGALIQSKIQYWSTLYNRLANGNGGINLQYAVPNI